MWNLIDNLNTKRTAMDKAFEEMHDAVKAIIVKNGGYINMANNDGQNDNVYSAVFDYCGAGELVETEVKAVKVVGDSIYCYVQPISHSVKTIYTDEDMLNDEEGWYLLDTTGDLLYHYTLIGIADVLEYGEYIDTTE